MTTALHALGWALLHFVWVGALMVATVPVLERALALRTAAARCALATIVLFAMPVAFALTLAATWSPSPGPVAFVRAAAGHGDTLVGLLAIGWVVGASLHLVRLAGGMWSLRRAIARSSAPDARWLAALERLARVLDVRRRVALVASTRIDVPMLVGWFRPVVLLPAALVAGAPAEVVEAALAHELAHLRRRDPLLNALQLVTEALLFYHPGVRWLASRVRAERENACDDLVVERIQDRLDYAWALTEIESLRSPVSNAALCATGGSLVQRIHRLVHPVHPSRRPAARLAASVLAIACVVGLAVPACIALAPEEVAQAQREGSEREAPPPPPDPPAAAASEHASAEGIDIAWLPEEVRAHEAEIVAAARRHGVDPELVAIVTLVESGGDARVRSPAGARGLMQIMPATAARIAAERGLADHEEDRLDDAAYNLELGTWYLARLLETYGGEEIDEHAIELAAAAYNGGERSAEAWLSGRGALSRETSKYKDRVTALWRARDDDELP